MRSNVVKVALVAVFVVASVALVKAPALADGGNVFFPGDGRVNPLTGDRLAVYCNPTSIDVLGIDGDNNGFYLTTFSTAEITSSKMATHTTPFGTVTLQLLQAPQTHIAPITVNDVTTDQLVFDQNAMYRITWTGGPYGANGSLPYIKTFGWGYDFASLTSAQ